MDIVKATAAYDDEAKVWYVEQSSLVGLRLEADTPVELFNKLPGAIEDLLKGKGEKEVWILLIAPGVFIQPGYIRIVA
jgi:Domain of unknown function (DUF1902)